MSGRLALGELHTVLQREAREARQFETNALSLLFKPRAQNANHDLVRYSLFRHRNITSEDLTCEESNPARNAIEHRVSVGAVAVTAHAGLFSLMFA